MKNLEFIKIKNIKFNLKLINKKISKYLHKTTKSVVFKSIVASVITFFILTLISFGFVWHFKQQAFNILASRYLEQVIPLNNEPVVPILEDDKSVEPLVIEKPKDPDNVINAVKRANPAVVSIILTRNVPKYTLSYKQESGSSVKTPVYTESGTKAQKLGGGSGFIISSDGFIVTNKHVVQSSDVVYTVYLPNGTNYIATVLARDPVLDIAILKINGSNLPYLTLGDSDTLEVGQSVVAIGNALNELKNSVSVGVVSGLSRSVKAGDGNGFSEKLDKVIQTDAAINSGNSGGPLLDLSGKVIGINVAVIKSSENIGFALPINSVKSVISSVKKTGKIQRPFIGMRYIAVTPEIQAEKELPLDYGVLIVKGKDDTEPAVLPNSPAQSAGLKEGDIVLEVDGQKIDSDSEFANIIRVKKIGSIMSLNVLSGNIYKTTYLVIGTAPDDL